MELLLVNVAMLDEPSVALIERIRSVNPDAFMLLTVRSGATIESSPVPGERIGHDRCSAASPDSSRSGPLAGAVHRDPLFPRILETLRVEPIGIEPHDDRPHGAPDDTLRTAACVTESTDPCALSGGLTIRERQVVSLIGIGHSNKDIALKLRLGYSTVKNYVSSILDKLGLQCRTQVALFAKDSDYT